MDKKVSKIIESFLNSSENYFHVNRIIEERVKVPKVPCDRPEGWNYKDIRDINFSDFNKIVDDASANVDTDLFNILPDTALKAALDMSIHTLCDSDFQKKIDARSYNNLLEMLKTRMA